MGYRIHVATKYEVRYSVGDAFNYKCEEFHNLLSLCGADYTGETYDPEFEVSKSDWEKVIEKLKNLDSLPQEEKEEITEAIEALEYSVDEIIEYIEYFLEQSDPSNSYLHLCYF